MFMGTVTASNRSSSVLSIPSDGGVRRHQRQNEGKEKSYSDYSHPTPNWELNDMHQTGFGS